MNRLLVDVNVVLDVLLDRKLHAETGAAVWASIEAGQVEGALAAHAVTTIYYLVRKELGRAKAARTLTALMRVFGVAPVDQAVIKEALQLPCPDFEDAVTAAAARFAGCDAIVTRDLKGFQGSGVRVLTPEAVVALLKR